MDKKKILVIDDEVSLCRVIKLNLESSDKFQVRTESKGTRGLTTALEFKPDLIILDYIMPDVDGGDVALQLQKNNMTKDIPVIFLTAIATKEDTQDDGALIGGRFVLAKPVSTEKLIKSIEKRLGIGE